MLRKKGLSFNLDHGLTRRGWANFKERAVVVFFCFLSSFTRGVCIAPTIITYLHHHLYSALIHHLDNTYLPRFSIVFIKEHSNVHCPIHRSSISLSQTPIRPELILLEMSDTQPPSGGDTSLNQQQQQQQMPSTSLNPEHAVMPLPDPITGRFDPNDPTVRALAEAALNPDKSKIPRPYKCPLCDRAFYRLEHQVSVSRDMTQSYLVQIVWNHHL